MAFLAAMESSGNAHSANLERIDLFGYSQGLAGWPEKFSAQRWKVALCSHWLCLFRIG